MDKKYNDGFAYALAKAATPEEVKNLLMVIMAQSEYEAIEQRYNVLELLSEGANYTEIVAKTGASSIMISRIDSTMSQNCYDAGVKEDAVKYGYFADIYDGLTEDVEYERRVNYIEKIFEKLGVKPELMADLACGTGTATKMFAERGYDMIGIDLSVQMLDKAREKSEGLDILYLNQPMEEFELYGTVDAIVCMLDSINYITEYEDLVQVFSLVNNYLNPGGVFVFDINTKYKLENVLAGNTFCEENGDVFYTWENYYDPEEKICEFCLNFFVKDGDSYIRQNETHYEKAYTTAEIKKALKKAGLTLNAVYDDLSFEPEKRNSERLYFVVTK